MPRELGALVVLAGLYCLASASEVLLVKGLNQQTVEFPVLTSALLNGYWPLQLAMYFLLLCRADDPRFLTWPILRGYLVVGFIATGVSLLPPISKRTPVFADDNAPVSDLSSTCTVRSEELWSSSASGAVKLDTKRYLRASTSRR